MKIGFIGLGNMGSAVAKAIATLGQHELLYSTHNVQKAESLQSIYGGNLLSNRQILKQADVIFLGVKPQILPSLLSDLLDSQETYSSKVWVSMAAGVTLTQLESWLPEAPVIRMMPNTPVAIGEGMTTFSTNQTELIPLFEELMKASGQVCYLEETYMDAATAIAGCGPAFVYEFIESLTRAGIQQGLPVLTAQTLASQTLLGGARMVLESEEHPVLLRDQVTSPGGATISGLVALTEAGFQAAIIRAVRASVIRTKELGEYDEREKNSNP